MRKIDYPQGDVTKMPIIGRILVEGIKFTWNGDEHSFDDMWEDVVAIVEGGEIYVVNKWYKPGVPQVRHKDLVKVFEPA